MRQWRWRWTACWNLLRVCCSCGLRHPCEYKLAARAAALATVRRSPHRERGLHLQGKALRLSEAAQGSRLSSSQHTRGDRQVAVSSVTSCHAFAWWQRRKGRSGDRPLLGHVSPLPTPPHSITIVLTVQSVCLPELQKICWAILQNALTFANSVVVLRHGMHMQEEIHLTNRATALRTWGPVQT